MLVHYPVFEKFYQLLCERFVEKEWGGKPPKGVNPVKGQGIWLKRESNGITHTASVYFQGKSPERGYKYFYNLSLKLLGIDHHEGAVDWDDLDDWSLFKALIFLNFYQEKIEGSDEPVTLDFYTYHRKNSWSKLYSLQKLERVYADFLKKFLPEYDPKKYPKPAPKAKRSKPGLLDSVLPPTEMPTKSQDALSLLTKAIQTAIDNNSVDDYLGLKGYIQNLFDVAEELLPVPKLFDTSILTETDDLDRISGHVFGEGEHERLYQYILDTRKPNIKRKNALRVFTVHRGLTDEQIAAVFSTGDMGVCRMASEQLSSLVSAENDTVALCKVVIDFALDRQELGANKKICKHLFSVNYEASLAELTRLFQIKEVYVPNKITTGLVDVLTKDDSRIATNQLADDTMSLAQRSLDYDPTSPQLIEKFNIIKNIVDEVRRRNGWV